MSDDLLSKIPGYREAVEKERADREQPILGLNETVCGIEVLPLSIWHLVLLVDIKSPLVRGEDYSMADCALALWSLSPRYQATLRICDSLRIWFPLASRLFMNLSRRGWLKQIRKSGKSKEEYGMAITRFLDAAFTDAPGSASKDEFAPSYHSNAVAIIGQMASIFHWSREYILRASLKELFQIQRWLILQRDPRAMLFNPSDALRGAWLAEENNRRQN